MTKSEFMGLLKIIFLAIIVYLLVSGNPTWFNAIKTLIYNNLLLVLIIIVIAVIAARRYL